MEFSFKRVLLIAEIKEIRKSEKGPPTTLPQQGSCERYFQQQIMILGGGGDWGVGASSTSLKHKT